MKLKSLSRDWLSHPLTRGLDIDDPRTTELRRRIIREKPFLYRLYQEWYEVLTNSMGEGREPVLEIGSGAGFLADFIPNLITSEVFHCSGLNVILNGCRLPFPSSSLRGIVMCDVLHHIPKPQSFLSEAARCVMPGGIMVMIEPWVSWWSTVVYTRLHHEPFLPERSEWEFPTTGPLSGANGALPWIIFQRDRIRFEQEFTSWKIVEIEPHTPFRYLLSGGVSKRCLMPGWSFVIWKTLEEMLSPFASSLAMFSTIILKRNL